MALELNIRFTNNEQFLVKCEDDESETLTFTSPFVLADFENLSWYLETYASSYITDVDDEQAEKIAATLKPLGEQLFNTVFSDSTARRVFNRFQESGEQRLITISANQSDILALPWELLCEPKATFLMHDKLSIRRRYAGAGAGRAAFRIQPKDQLRLLFVVSRPKGAGFLNPRSEAQAVLQAIHATHANVSVEFLRPATLDNLVDRLENEDLPAIDIIHFDGHGAFNHDESKDLDTAKQDNDFSKGGLQSNTGYLLFEDEDGLQSNTGYLLFENKDGDKDLISAEILADALYQKKVPLLVLSACQSATVGGNDVLNSIAARLTHAGIPAVLAMSYSVLVQTTELLFKAFYADLAKGKTIGSALDTARRFLDRNRQRGTRQRGTQHRPLELHDWFVPTLYQASSDGSLLNKTAPKGSDNTELVHNLPDLQEAGFFGRNKELWQIERAFVQGTRRMTITGFGGQGKTYLAIEAGLWLSQTGLFQCVCFINYAAFQGVNAVDTAVAALATVLHESLLDSNAATLALQHTATLVILDNLETLKPAALSELLTAAQAWSEAGDSRVLLTTRAAEFAHSAYPKEGSRRHISLPLRGLAEADALAFYQSLQKLPPEPRFQSPERAVLLALFAQVDFHPLSIAILSRELKFCRPANLGTRLEALLNAVPANSENKSLIASLNLSLARLSPEQRALVQRLGVFQGGAFEDDLLEITEINATAWADLRPALESTGLIQLEYLTHLNIAPPYLKFHPTLAPVLWQALNAEQQQALAERYRQRYYQLSGWLYREDNKNPHAARAIAQRELPNLLAAVYAALHAGDAFAVEFVEYVNCFLGLFGLSADKAALTDAIQKISSDGGSDNWVLTRSQQAEQFYQTGQYSLAISIYQDIIEALGKTPSYNLCLTLGRLGRCFRQQGKTTEAIGYYQQALAVAEQLEPSINVQRQIGLLHTDLADVFSDSGDFVEAKSHYEQSLAVAEKTGDTLGIAVVQGQLGTLAMLQGDLPDAEQRYKAALKLFSKLNEPQTVAIVWHQLGVVYQKANTWQAAEDAYRQSARIEQDLGNLAGAAGTWTNLALVTQAQGKLAAAENWYRKAIQVQKDGDPKNFAASLNNLADLLQKQANRLAEARQLAEQALTIRKTLDEASAEIWKTYDILEIITEQQGDAQAARYRQDARDSYLRYKGMPTQMRQNGWLIAEVINAVVKQAVDEELSTDLQKLKQAGNDKLVLAIQQILSGERNETSLLEPLDYTDAAIIHLILLGINQPDKLASLFD